MERKVLIAAAHGLSHVSSANIQKKLNGKRRYDDQYSSYYSAHCLIVHIIMPEGQIFLVPDAARCLQQCLQILKRTGINDFPRQCDISAAECTE